MRPYKKEIKDTKADIEKADSNTIENAKQPVTKFPSGVFQQNFLPHLGAADILSLNATCRFFHARIPAELKQKAAEFFRYDIQNLMNQLAQHGQGEQILKCVFVGDANTNKTQIARHYAPKSQPFSLGVDFLMKHFDCGPEKSIRLQLWDTAGQGGGNQLLRPYLRNARIVACVASSADPRLLGTIRYWMKSIDANCDQQPKVPVVRALLINTFGNAQALAPEGFVQLCHELRADFGPDLLCYEVNSDTTLGVNEALDNITGHALHNVLQATISANNAAQAKKSDANVEAGPSAADASQAEKSNDSVEAAPSAADASHAESSSKDDQASKCRMM